MDEPPISRGFRSRQNDQTPRNRVPPGQYVTTDFPVLSAGPTPHVPLDQWTFTIKGGVEPVSWTRAERGRVIWRRAVVGGG